MMTAICFAEPLLLLPALLLWLDVGRRRGMGAAALLLFAALALALHTHTALTEALAARLPLALSGDEFRLRVRVVDLPERTLLGGGGRRIERVRFLARTESADPRWPGRHSLQLSWFSADTSAVQAGATLDVRVRLRPPFGQINDRGFDAERHALARRIDARGTVLTLQPLAAATGIAVQREQLVQLLEQRYAAHPGALALLPALVAGDRRGLGAEHWALLQNTGTAHLVAISGLHISLVAGLLWALAFWLISALRSGTDGRLPAQVLAAVPAMLAAAGYAALAGFSLPTQRALLMTVLAMLCLLGRRRPQSGQILLLAALAVTVPAPLAWLDTSFWLSFGAVALLVFLHRAGGAGLLRMQVVLTLVFGLLAAELFALWSASALPANLLIVPLFSLLLVPLALIDALLPASSWLSTALVLLTDGSWAVLGWFASWPSLPLPLTALVAALLAVSLLPLLLPAWPGPRWVLLAAVLPWLWPDTPTPAPGQVELVVFDVGQGQMVALRTRQHLVLYDLGPGWHDGDAASRVLRPWLRRQRRDPDLIFISHGDLDHAGGIAAFPPLHYRGRLFTGEVAAVPAGLPCLRGQRWWFDEVSFEVLWPPPDMPLRHSNNRSCVLMVRAANQRILLTGDIGREVEYWLAEHDDLRAEVLQVPHHGSASSSSFALLHAVAPAQAFASAGHDNHFGHPAASIVARYRELAIPLTVTGHSGMLIYAHGADAAPLRWRQHSAFPWRLPEPVVE